MTTEPSDRAIVRTLLRGAVPERADEISSLRSQYGHAVEVAPSTKGVTMNADATRIQFDTKTIDLFWLFGFNAWRAIEVYSPALALATIRGMPLDQALNADTDTGTPTPTPTPTPNEVRSSWTTSNASPAPNSLFQPIRPPISLGQQISPNRLPIVKAWSTSSTWRRSILWRSP